jgi:hypothetical protein
MDKALAHAGHSAHTMECAVPPPSWKGHYPLRTSTSSPISSRDVAGEETAHLEERTSSAPDCSKRQVKAESK